MDNTDAKWYENIGGVPQGIMIFSFIACTFIEDPNKEVWTWGLSIVGSAGFLYCLYQLYVLKKRETTLITTGLYKYTRHPMYLSLAIMDLAFWFPLPTSPLFYILQAVWLVTLVLAAKFQEEETPARFGRDAELYYLVTPRIPFLI
jgi:protein-S-isoprenylcysteine O-methyltransferase Ste14